MFENVSEWIKLSKRVLTGIKPWWALPNCAHNDILLSFLSGEKKFPFLPSKTLTVRQFHGYFKVGDVCFFFSCIVLHTLFKVIARSNSLVLLCYLRPLYNASWNGRPKNPFGPSSSVVVVQLQSRTWPGTSEHPCRSRTDRSLGSEISQHQTVATSWFATAEYHQRHCYTGTKRSPSICVKLYPIL